MTLNERLELARQEQPVQLSVKRCCNARRVEAAPVALQTLADDVCDASISFCRTQSGPLRTGSLASQGNLHWRRLVQTIDAWHVRQQVLGCNSPLIWPQNDLRWVPHQKLSQSTATSMLGCVIFREPFALSME